MEFQERGLTMWEFRRTWDGDIFRRVAIVVLHRFKSDAKRELSAVGSVVATNGNTASAVAISSGSDNLVRLMQNTWAVGTQRDCLSTQSLICCC